VIAKGYDALRLAVGEGKTFSGPTLFIRGGLSKYIQERNFAVIQQQFPQATIETIENASHWLHAEKPRQFADLVKHFILGSSSL
jgi:pimeloyl-ACP methyl ester carboxylesterase